MTDMVEVQTLGYTLAQEEGKVLIVKSIAIQGQRYDGAPIPIDDASQKSIMQMEQRHVQERQELLKQLYESVTEQSDG